MSTEQHKKDVEPMKQTLLGYWMPQSIYRELVTLEYVLTHGYDEKGDEERYMEIQKQYYVESNKIQL